jgi:hypothetical protein
MLTKAPPQEPGSEPRTEVAVVSRPNFQTAAFHIKGTALVMNKFSSANRTAMMKKQQQGSQSRKGQQRKAKDFDAVYRGAMHVMSDGRYGFAAPGLRNALISACRLVGFKMTIAKLSIFVEADGLDADDGTPLVAITGEPVRKDMAVRLADGSTDIVARPFFETWSAEVRLKWDADQFSSTDIVNLLMRAGTQVGIGAGRHDSKSSTGMGWGCFEVSMSVGGEDEREE